MRQLLLRFSAIWLFAFAATTADAAGERQHVIPSSAPRMALLIGNAKYKLLTELANPGNDIVLIAGVLRTLGFETIVHRDLGRRAMQDAVDDFAARLKARGSDTVGLVFFAGHGLEAESTNYMVPVDADIQREDDIARASLSVAAVAKQIAASGNQLNILILDACRNNPYRNRSRNIGTRGLTPMGAIFGVFIASSTASGDLAGDGNGPNSPYATALAASIATPGLKLEDVFKSVRRRVRSLSKQGQIPWESSSLEADFYFLPPEMTKSPAEELLSIARETRSVSMLEMIQKRFRGTREADEAVRLADTLTAEDISAVNEQQARTQYELASRLQSFAALDEVARTFPTTQFGAKAAVEAKILTDNESKSATQRTAAEKLRTDSLTQYEADRSLKMAQESNTIAAYELVAKLFPYTASAAVASTSAARLRLLETKKTSNYLAEQLFQRAEQSKTPDAYEAVSQLYPDSPVALQAQKLAARLKDAAASSRQVNSKLEGADLVRAIQSELRRIGCDLSEPDGTFNRQTVAALRSFATVSDDRFHWHRPTHAALRAIQIGTARCEPKVATRSTAPKCVQVLKERFCD